MTHNTASDARTPGFFFVDNEIVSDYDLGPYAGWLYVTLARYVNNKQGVAFPSLSTIAKKAGMTEPTVIKYLYVLVDKGLLYIYQSQDANGDFEVNHYELRPVPKVVNEVNQGGKTDKPGVVNEVEGKNTSFKKTSEESSADAPNGAQHEPPDETKTPEPIEVESEPTAPPPKRKPRKNSKPKFSADEMNPVKDEIVRLFGWDWDTMTTDESGQVQKAAYGWLRSNGKLEQLRIVFAYCKAHYETFGPNALTSNKSKAMQSKYAVQVAPVSRPPEPQEDICGSTTAFMQFVPEAVQA